MGLLLVGTITALVIVIAGLIAIRRGRRSHQSSTATAGIFLLVLSAVVLWILWAQPRSAPPPASLSPEETAEKFRLAQTALPTDTPEMIIRKMGCAVCHKIPAVPDAIVGVVGPPLMLRTTAPLRLASPEYQARVRAGLAHATTPQEYVIESIVNPAAFIVPGYEIEKNPNMAPMYPHYRDRFTPEALQFLALFLLQLDEALARKEGLLNPPAMKQP